MVKTQKAKATSPKKLNLRPVMTERVQMQKPNQSAKPKRSDYKIKGTTTGRYSAPSAEKINLVEVKRVPAKPQKPYKFGPKPPNRAERMRALAPTSSKTKDNGVLDEKVFRQHLKKLPKIIGGRVVSKETDAFWANIAKATRKIDKEEKKKEKAKNEPLPLLKTPQRPIQQDYNEGRIVVIRPSHLPPPKLRKSLRVGSLVVHDTETLKKRTEAADEYSRLYPRKPGWPPASGVTDGTRLPSLSLSLWLPEKSQLELARMLKDAASMGSRAMQEINELIRHKYRSAPLGELRRRLILSLIQCLNEYKED